VLAALAMRARRVLYRGWAMPELPDVEIARRDLRRWMAGATLVAARCADRRLLRPSSPRAFARALVGKTVERVERKGKWLKVVLEGDGRLFSHLGMTGEWVHEARDAPCGRFERARLDVSKRGRSTSVRYHDSRRFGRLVVAREDIAEWTALGPDPLDGGLDVGHLSVALARSRRAVKDVLMDQTVLAGIGNILATEALWHARVDPRSSSAALSPPEVRAVARALRDEIARELAERTGRDSDVRPQEARGSSAVYGRYGQPCPRCGTALSRVTLAGRTSVFCKKCQTLRE
jgi:formamidopyrimidine-DNA glycosylase